MDRTDYIVLKFKVFLIMGVGLLSNLNTLWFFVGLIILFGALVNYHFCRRDKISSLKLFFIIYPFVKKKILSKLT